jgi:hypothetical protein
VGNILEDSIGQNAKKKIPKRCINMIAGNISSYSRVLNNQKSLDFIAEANLLSSCISKISVAKEIAKDAAKEKREQEQKSREGNKADDRASLRTRLPIPAGILRIPVFSVPVALFSQES